MKRKNCIDIWNAFMVKKSSFDPINDIPICFSSFNVLPKKLISYDDAKTLYNKKIKHIPDFFDDSYIHFYIDDQKFDGKKSSIWLYPKDAYKVIKHFAGIITPDFSTYAGFPKPIKLFNTYRMRAFGCWMNDLGIQTINNVRWGTSETWSYCFDGIPYKSVVSIGTVASNLKSTTNRKIFEDGFWELIKRINPPIIIVYGSDNYRIFLKAKNMGIKIIPFRSKKNIVFSEVYNV